MGTVVRLLLALLAAFTLLPWSAVILHRSWQGVRGWPEDGLATALGLAVAVGLVIWRKPNKFIHTLIHEGCHALVCCCLFVKVSRFSASDGMGGEVRHRKVDPVRTTLIAIAPYTLPLLLGPVLILHATLPAWNDWRPFWSFVVILLYAHHLVGLERNVRINFWGSESDLAKVGRPLSLVLIASVLMLVTAWVIEVLW